MPNQPNPLRQYFRQPAIYIRLPSKGRFYPAGTLEMPANNELPVLAMTAIDEITYRTPDALYNGQATVDVIQSCVPNIKDAWAVPAMDVDTILTAIRIASHGHEMNFETTCPKCQNVSEQVLDLRTVLDNMRTPNYDQDLKHGDMEIYFKPMSYKNLNDNNQLQYENQKMLQLMPDNDELPDTEKMSKLSMALKRITEITVIALAQSISAIKTPAAMVNEPEFIVDFLKNCDRKLFDRIRDYIIETKAAGEIQPLKITCPECQNQYEQAVTLDMASFFESAS
jgi:hypothetical protein